MHTTDLRCHSAYLTMNCTLSSTNKWKYWTTKKNRIQICYLRLRYFGEFSFPSGLFNGVLSFQRAHPRTYSLTSPQLRSAQVNHHKQHLVARKRKLNTQYGLRRHRHIGDKRIYTLDGLQQKVESRNCRFM